MLNWVISVLSFCLLLGGRTATNFVPCHVVTEISIQWTEEGKYYHRIYRDPGKLNKVLFYLRTLKPQSPTQPMEPSAGPEYTIQLALSDGSGVDYTQLGLTTFRKTNGAWQVIDPEDSVRLPLILAAIPGDDVF